MKLLWHSNAPHAGTGYGQQTSLFVPRLRDLGHDIAISALWGVSGAVLDWQGIRVYPSDDAFGNRTLPALAAHWADGDECLTITLIDVWPLKMKATAEFRLAHWCPVDHEPIPPPIRRALVQTEGIPIAMTRFGERELERAGFHPLYVPHGIDTTIFRPLDDEQARVREAFNIPEDAFVVGMVAANKGNNPSRKSFPQVFQAFSRFRHRHPEAVLFLHTAEAKPEGLNLRALADACEIPRPAIRFTPDIDFELGCSQDSMAHLYAMMDVLASPSMGEGFGIPIIEAQACGVPVIVSDFTAMSELLGAGWKVTGDRWWDAFQESWLLSPSVREIEDALEQAYVDARDPQLRATARVFAEQYDADHVTDTYWRPALTELTGKRNVEVPPLEAVAA